MPSTYNKFREALFASSGEVEREIKELKFGCKLLTKDDKVANYIERSSLHYWIITEDGDYYDIGLREYKEIIGRDITLEDVLMAIKNKIKMWGDITIKVNGDIVEQTDYDTYKILGTWQLGKPAHEQSDETLIQITKLLQ